MANPDTSPIYEMVYVIVNNGMGSKVLQRAKKLGFSGGTILYGKGTVDSTFLMFLSLYDVRKEIVMLGARKKTADNALAELNKEFEFEKQNHGIAFTTSVNSIIGSKYNTCEIPDEERGVNNSMYCLITIIVKRGDAEDVIEAATSAGAKGGTIINARGSGIHETSKLFKMEIEPEKEIVMIISKKDVTDGIAAAIREKMKMDKPGNGLILIQDVATAYGIYE